MVDILKWIMILLIIVGVFFLVWGLTHKNNVTSENNTKEELKQLGIYKSCKTNFECDLGFFCEFRTLPTTGICVIAPGGACHKNSDKDGICYSGYYCDAQDGTCLKK